MQLSLTLIDARIERAIKRDKERWRTHTKLY